MENQLAVVRNYGRQLFFLFFNVMAVGYVRGEGQGCVLRPPHEKKAKEELNCLQRKAGRNDS